MAQPDTTDVRKFNPSAGAHAVRDFIWHGHTYLAGEPFPIEDLSDDKARMLWHSGRISFGKPSKPLVAALAKRAADQKARDEREAAHAKAKAAKAAAKAKAATENAPQPRA